MRVRCRSRVFERFLRAVDWSFRFAVWMDEKWDWAASVDD